MYNFIVLKLFGVCICYSIPGHILMTRYCMINLAHTFFVECHDSGADPGFRGAHLNKLRRAEGGAKIVGVFRVKNPPL
jgi:hypothetical protein